MTRPTSTEPSLDTFCCHGQRLLAAGSARKALRVFQSASVRYPLESAPWIGLGWCQQELGDPAAAAVAYTMARALGVDHPGLAVRAAECKVRLGDKTGARRDLEEALATATATDDYGTAERARRALEWLEDGAATGPAEVRRS